MELININYITDKFYNFSTSSIKKINSDYKKSAVMCLFLENDNKVYILLTKRSQNLSNHAGEICFPGGKVELGAGIGGKGFGQCQICGNIYMGGKRSTRGKRMFNRW